MVYVIANDVTSIRADRYALVLPLERLLTGQTSNYRTNQTEIENYKPKRNCAENDVVINFITMSMLPTIN